MSADNENEERTRIVSNIMSFTGLNTHPCHDRFQRMTIAYSIPEEVQSDIAVIKGADNLSEEEKEQHIEQKLLNETNCHGYFFEQTPSMYYKQLCLEMYDENLDTYIREKAIQNDFQWTLLQDLCRQLVDSMTWLHQNKIDYNGRLHPQNIFVKKTVLHGRTIIKLRVPDKMNPFNNLDEFYSSFWKIQFKVGTQDQEIKRDMASIIVLVYFIQSAGYHLFQVFEKRQDEKEHPDWPENRNDKTYINLIRNIENRNKDVRALEQNCFCIGNPNATCNVPACKQRVWINSLAKDWINCRLGELFKGETVHYTTSSSILKKHPFFWTAREILNFIERSSNFLKESGAITPEALSVFLENFSEVKQNYPSIIKYLEEPNPDRKPKKTHLIIEKFIINNKDFRTLLDQIRNKSAHWNDSRSNFRKDAIAELNKIKFVEPPDNEMNIFPDKYCLFWMCNFPTLLLDTWNNLKNDVNH